MQEAFGDDWWSALLLHMREDSSSKNGPSGTKYSWVLRKYGRGIRFEDLDTSVLCTIILFDDYYREGRYSVPYTAYEISLAKQLHSLRNRISHDEADGSTDEAAEKQTMQLLREAVDRLDLVATNPQLASEIMEEYAKVFCIEESDQSSLDLISSTARFQEAENLFKWDVEKAIPIYQELAQSGYRGAQERLLYIYTHTIRNFDLDAAAELAEAYPGIISEEKLQRLRNLRDSLPHVLWGSQAACVLFEKELDGKDIIQNDQILKYIKWIQSTYKGGLLRFWPTKDDSEIKTEVFDIHPDCDIVKRMIVARPTGDQEAEFAAFLIWLTETQRFEPAYTQKVLEQFARRGFLPLIDYFAAVDYHKYKRTPGAKVPTGSPWIKLGIQKGSALCTKIMDAISENDTENNQDSPTDKSKTNDLEDTIASLQEEIKKLKRIIKILAAAAVIGIIIALLI